MEHSGGCNDGGAIRLQRGVIGTGLDRLLRHQAEEPPVWHSGMSSYVANHSPILGPCVEITGRRIRLRSGVLGLGQADFRANEQIQMGYTLYLL